ncbi:hypothetical protein ACO1O0_008763 [Amphichorda felina]
MSSNRQLWPQARRLDRLVRQNRAPASSICPFCSVSPAARLPPRPRRQIVARRHQSTATTTSNPRAELEQTLQQLQDQTPYLVDLSRLQLALNGLRQNAGEEDIRIAILGLENGDHAGLAAKRVLRAFLTDPLVDEQPWEKELDAYDPSQPLIVRVRPDGREEGTLTMERVSGLNEVHISSAALNGLNLELLLTETSLATDILHPLTQTVEETILSPIIDVPIDEDRVSQVPAPVHKTLLIASGLSGAVRISALPLPILENTDTVLAASNMEGLSKQQLDAAFEVVDVSLAEKALALFRKGPEHAMEYERLWSASNMPTLVNWLKSGLATTDAATKPIVRRLIAQLLQDTLSSVQEREALKVSKALAIKNLPQAGELNGALAEWAQNAHAELQGELDLAFTGRRWRKLGWWKLFWRVDDVAMLTNEMLSQRFLPTAEQELVYLTGRIAGPAGEHPPYSQPTSSRAAQGATHTSTKLGSGEVAPVSPILPKWPGHIAFTRRYLQNETIPALQALAQKLVVQAIGTSSVATSLGALLYVSSFASTVYEAGAVAALGIVYSLGRMQKKWETARGFWEGEVREEGRKAVRGVEGSVTDVLEGTNAVEDGSKEAEELRKARELVAKAEDALGRMK